MSNNFLKFNEFVEKVIAIEQAGNEALSQNLYLEEFFDKLISEGIFIEEVITGDIAQVTSPLMTLKRRAVYEKAPTGEKAERFINKNKVNFKKRYGDDWEQILYATAWKMFGNKN